MTEFNKLFNNSEPNSSEELQGIKSMLVEWWIEYGNKVTDISVKRDYEAVLCKLDDVLEKLISE